MMMHLAISCIYSVNCTYPLSIVITTLIKGFYLCGKLGLVVIVHHNSATLLLALIIIVVCLTFMENLVIRNTITSVIMVIITINVLTITIVYL